MNWFLRNGKKMLPVALLLVAAAGWTVWRCLPADENGMIASAVIVETHSWYELCADGRPVIFFTSLADDSTAQNIASTSEAVRKTDLNAGCWINRMAVLPSCSGRIVTANPDSTLKSGDAKLIAKTARNTTASLLKSLKAENYELDYYLRVHGVQDDGYASVAALSMKMKKMMRQAEAALKILNSISPTRHLTLRRRCLCKAFYRDETGRIDSLVCIRRTVSHDRRAMLIQTADGIVPSSAHPQTIVPWWTKDDNEILVTGFGGMAYSSMESLKTAPFIVPGRKHGPVHDVPRLLAPDGSPVFASRGRFLGIVIGNRIFGRRDIKRLLRQEGGWL